MGPGFHFRGIYYYVSKVGPTQASTIRKSLVLYRERGGVDPCVVLYCGPQWYYGKRRLIFMPVPVVQTELIWTETRIKLSLVGPSPWLLPLGAGRRWAGKDGHNTSPRRRRSVIAYCTLAPFRSIKRAKMATKRSKMVPTDQRSGTLGTLGDGDLCKNRTTPGVKILQGARERVASHHSRQPPPGPPMCDDRYRAPAQSREDN